VTHCRFAIPIRNPFLWLSNVDIEVERIRSRYEDENLSVVFMGVWQGKNDQLHFWKILQEWRSLRNPQASGHGLPKVSLGAAMPYLVTPCGWLVCRVGSLRPSSTPLDTPHPTPLVVLKNCFCHHLIRNPRPRSLFPIVHVTYGGFSRRPCLMGREGAGSYGMGYSRKGIFPDCDEIKVFFLISG
jgi:hypothetical protein